MIKNMHHTYKKHREAAHAKTLEADQAKETGTQK